MPKPRKREMKPRKPKDAVSWFLQDDEIIFIQGGYYSEGEARRLAAWLTRAADYLEARKR